MTGRNVSSDRSDQPLLRSCLFLALTLCGACASGKGALYYDHYLVTANAPIPVLASLPADGSWVRAGTLENHGNRIESGAWPAARWRHILKLAQEQQCQALLFDPHRLIFVDFDADHVESGVLFQIPGVEPKFAGIRVVCLKSPGAAGAAGPAS